jgi:hypothetical protein
VVFFNSQPQGMTLSSLWKDGTRLVSCASGPFQCFAHCIDIFFNKQFCFSFLASLLLGPLPLQWLQLNLFAGMTGTLDKVQLNWLRWSLTTILLQLTSDYHPPSLCLRSGWDYRLWPLFLAYFKCLRLRFQHFMSTLSGLCSYFLCVTFSVNTWSLWCCLGIMTTGESHTG